MSCMEYHCGSCGEVNWQSWTCPNCGRQCATGLFDEYVGDSPPPNVVRNPNLSMKSITEESIRPRRDLLTDDSAELPKVESRKGIPFSFKEEEYL